MKKALVYREARDGRVVGQVEMIMDAAEMDKWSHHILAFTEKVEIPSGLEQVPQHLLEGVLKAVPTILDPTITENKWVIQKKASADLELRKNKLNELRSLREPLLKEADIQINKLMDANLNALPWRTYRQTLRDITKSMLKVNGDPKASVDSLDLTAFIFPVKPV